ncbi:MAG: DNA gyrase inhibitor YacG [Myxococcales bacterium]|nr:DNA gyrase inhibitor YacG [Myxococcota bacterium]MDW8280502.1 DNA gyrase inhibitor YacG [Myxococcales bacterium]
MQPRCPICGAPPSAEAFPFCSSRCRLIDLGNWLGERYVVPGDSTIDPSRVPMDEDGGDSPQDGS